MMSRTSSNLLMLLTATCLLPLTVSAQISEGAMPLPPPPGPYISSRSQLETSTVTPANNNRMPFVGNMPSPMRYMPPANQLPTPPPWWRGPNGR